MVRKLGSAGPASECLYVIVPRNSTHIAFSLALAASVLGCTDHRALTKTETWFKPSDHRSAARAAAAVEWVEVAPSASAEVERRLSSTEAERVSPDEASKYAARPFKVAENEEVYLVRGLYLNRGTGGFTVTFDG